MQNLTFLRKHAESILAAALLLSSVLLNVCLPALVEAPRLNLFGGSGALNPLVYPRWVLVLLSVISLLYLVQTLWRAPADDETPTTELTGSEMRHFWGTLGVLVGYLLGIIVLGFWIATPFFVLGLGLYWGSPRSVWVLLVPALTTTFVYLLFGNVLKIVFPVGILFG